MASVLYEAEVKSKLNTSLTPLMQQGRVPVDVLVETLTSHKVFMQPISLKTLVQEHFDFDVKLFLELLHFDRHSGRWQLRRLPSVRSPNVRFTFTSYENGILAQDNSSQPGKPTVKIENTHAKL